MVARIAGVIPLALLLGTRFSFASASERFGAEALHGLRGAYVTVHYTGKVRPEAGLTEALIASEVSLRLRIAGLNVLTEEGWRKTAGKPYLFVNIIDTGIPGTKGAEIGQVFTCSLDLMQEASLTRSRETNVDVCTWSRGATLVIPSDDLGQVRVLVGDLASEFTSAVAAANHRGGESTSSRPLEK